MTVLLSLTTEQEQKLTQAAQARGLDADLLLHEVLDTALAQLESMPALMPKRMPDLHIGQTWVSDDFDAPLPDSFWLGEE